MHLLPPHPPTLPQNWYLCLSPILTLLFLGVFPNISCLQLAVLNVTGTSSLPLCSITWETSRATYICMSSEEWHDCHIQPPLLSSPGWQWFFFFFFSSRTWLTLLSLNVFLMLIFGPHFPLSSKKKLWFFNISINHAPIIVHLCCEVISQGYSQ